MRICTFLVALLEALFRLILLALAFVVSFASCLGRKENIVYVLVITTSWTGLGLGFVGGPVFTGVSEHDQVSNCITQEHQETQ